MIKGLYKSYTYQQYAGLSHVSPLHDAARYAGSTQKLATFVKLPSRSWRAVVRRKARYIGETFRQREDARRWAMAAEGAIDRGGKPKPTRIAGKRTPAA